MKRKKYIKKFKNFINENKLNTKKTLYYYCFDWDDNLLNMETNIHCEKMIDGQWIPIDVSTSEFANLRSNLFELDGVEYRIKNDNPGEAFSDFRDDGPKGKRAFIDDVVFAITNKKFANSWNDFIECLTNGSIFAIITARGHESESIRMGIEYIIDNYLTNDQQEEMYRHLLKYVALFKEIGQSDSYEKHLKGQASKNELIKNYLDECEYIGVSSPSRGGTPKDPEKAKSEALTDFIIRIDKYAKSVGYAAKIGFSDDDIKNVKHIEQLFNNIHKEKFPNILEFVLKNTNNPDKTKRTIYSKLRDNVISEGNTTAGLEGSTISLQSFDSFINKFRNDKNIMLPYEYTKNRQSDFLAKLSFDLRAELKNKFK